MAMHFMMLRRIFLKIAFFLVHDLLKVAFSLILKEKGNINVAYDCIQIVTISAVGERVE
jgi:hypothetical protein